MLCVDTLIIGKAEPNTEYILWFESQATSALYRYLITSDSTGILTLELPPGFALASHTLYKMWINKPTDSVDTRQELYVGANIGYCFLISAVVTRYGYYNMLPVTETLEVE